MTGRTWAAAFVVAFGVVTVSAQSSSTQAPPRDTPQAPAAQDPSQRPPAPTPAPAPAPAPATPSDRDRPAKLTLTGCIQRSAQSAVPGATGTAGAKSESSFMLNNVSKPTGTAGAASTASSYALDADDSKLAPHVGHKVEISGSLDQAGSSRAGSAPKLKVDNVKMISTSCSD
jgi:hypothetical protein